MSQYGRDRKTLISDFEGMKTSENILRGPKPKVTYFTEPKNILQDRRKNTAERNFHDKGKKETQQ